MTQQGSRSQRIAAFVGAPWLDMFLANGSPLPIIALYSFFEPVFLSRLKHHYINTQHAVGLSSCSRTIFYDIRLFSNQVLHFMCCRRGLLLLRFFRAVHSTHLFFWNAVAARGRPAPGIHGVAHNSFAARQ